MNLKNFVSSGINSFKKNSFKGLIGKVKDSVNKIQNNKGKLGLPMLLTILTTLQGCSTSNQLVSDFEEPKTITPEAYEIPKLETPKVEFSYNFLYDKNIEPAWYKDDEKQKKEEKLVIEKPFVQEKTNVQEKKLVEDLEDKPEPIDISKIGHLGLGYVLNSKEGYDIGYSVYTKNPVYLEYANQIISKYKINEITYKIVESIYLNNNKEIIATNTNTEIYNVVSDDSETEEVVSKNEISNNEISNNEISNNDEDKNTYDKNTYDKRDKKVKKKKSFRVVIKDLKESIKDKFSNIATTNGSISTNENKIKVVKKPEPINESKRGTVNDIGIAKLSFGDEGVPEFTGEIDDLSEILIKGYDLKIKDFLGNKDYEKWLNSYNSVGDSDKKFTEEIAYNIAQDIKVTRENTDRKEINDLASK